MMSYKAEIITSAVSEMVVQYHGQYMAGVACVGQVVAREMGNPTC